MTLPVFSDQTPSPDLQISVAQAVSGLDKAWQRLRGGRVNALWRVGDIVVKQFQPSGASPLFPNDPAAEAAALSHLAPYGLAPTLLAQGTGWIAYRYCAGAAWRRDASIVAAALATLHRVAYPVAGFRKGANGSAALIAHAKSIAAQCRSALPPLPADRGVEPADSCLIHGDAVPGNIIAHGQKITFIDWQCPAIGDPAEDIATFLSPAMQYLYRGAPLSLDEVAAFRAASTPSVIARYDRLADLYHWRMAAHCLWKSENGASDYVPALRLELAALQRVPQYYTRKAKPCA
jgi:thiamine kinase